MNEKEIRSRYVALQTGVYLDSAAFGLLSAETNEASWRVLNQLALKGSPCHKDLQSLVEATRLQTRHYLNAKGGTLSFIPGFSYGLQLIVSHLKIKRKALLLADDYPSLFSVWKTYGDELVVIDIPVDEPFDYKRYFSQVLDNKINVVIISHVNYLCGRKIDLYKLHEFCKEHAVMLIVDGTQSFGFLNYDLLAFSHLIFISSCYKWVGAGYGLGILYISPAANTWLKDSHFQEKSTTLDQRFELSHYNFEAIARLHQAMTERMFIGQPNIVKYVTDLTQFFYNQIDPALNKMVFLIPEERSAIMSIDQRAGLFGYLLSNKIVISQRGKYLRISPHFYNTENDLQKLLSLLNTYTFQAIR